MMMQRMLSGPSLGSGGLRRSFQRLSKCYRPAVPVCGYHATYMQLQQQGGSAHHSTQHYKGEAPKTSTALTGLPVDINWRDTLTELYNRTLEEVKVSPRLFHALFGCIQWL